MRLLNHRASTQKTESLTSQRSTSLLLALGLTAICPLVGGCGTTPEETPPGSDANISLADANNYRGVATLTIPSIQTAPNADLQICFDAITQNLQCHQLQPIPDIDNVSFIRVPNLTQAEVTQKLEADTFVTADSDRYFAYNTDDLSPCVQLGGMEFPDDTFIDLANDYSESATHTYLLLFSKGTTPGKGAQAMMYLQPTSASTNTSIVGETGCNQLAFVPDLHTPAPLVVPTAGPWEISWAGLTVDGMGNPLKFQNVDEMLVGFYANMTIADLEAGIFDLESLPSALWRLPISPGKRSANLAAAVDSLGAAFPGFTQPGAGVWVFGLLCDDCQTPAPLVLTVLTPQ